MRSTKRLGALFIALVMIFTMIPITTAGAADLSGTIVLTMNSTEFSVNGTKTKIDEQGSKPVQEKGYTMLPLRAVMEATGGTLTYDGDTQKITITRGGDTVALSLGSKTAVVNGANRTLGAAPYATNGRTMVHIRTLELFGMKVDWEEKTNNVTVHYVEPTKIFNLTLQNGMGTAYTSIQIAPMLTTSESDWSGNLLGADTLNVNQNLIVQAPITGSGSYQLRCGYATSGQTMYHTIQNITLTGMTDRATILMNSTTNPGISIDGASATSRTIQLYVVNNTGTTIQALYGKKTSDTFYNQNNNLLSAGQMLVSGGTATVNFNYDSNVSQYNFFAQATTGTYLPEYKNVKLNVATSGQTFATLTLGPDGLTNSSNTTNGTNGTTGDTEIRFTNNSGSTIYELRASTSSRSTSIKNGEVIWSDTSGLKNGKTVTFNMDIGSYSKWYFGAFTSKTSSASIAYSGEVNFKKTNCTYAKVVLDVDDEYELQDWWDCSECETDEYDYDDDDYEDAKASVVELFEDAKAAHKKLDSTIDEDEYDDLSSSERRHYDSSSGSGSSFRTSDHKFDGKASSSKSDGSVDLVVLNSMTDKIEALYAIEKSDYTSKMSSYDYEDIEDDNDFVELFDGSTLKAESYEFISDALNNDTTYYFAVFDSTKSSAKPINTINKFSIKVDDDADYAVMNIKSKSTCTTFDSEDGQYLIWIENDSGEDIKKVSFTEDTSRSAKTVTSSAIDDEEFASVVLDTDSYGDDWDIEVEFKDNYDDIDDDISLDDYDYGFIHMVIGKKDIDFNEAD